MALKKLGVPVEYIVYPAMPHGLTEPRYQMVKMVAEFNWIEKWIQGKPDWFDWKQLLATLEEPTEEEKKQPQKTDQDQYPLASVRSGHEDRRRPETARGTHPFPLIGTPTAQTQPS